MEKLKMQSLDVTGSNIDKITRLFPQCVTERKYKDGKTVLGIDFEKLRDELSADVIDDGEERYQFTWPDKKAHAHLANTPTTKTLRPCREESVDFDHTQNLYIEGDNLDVLKVLRETYLGKVKMIYIDPPYNTGNDFVYNDNFSQETDEYKENSGQLDEDGNRLVQNTEYNGRFHTDWLNMIYPRLKVAKDLLTEDGLIFISIDDNEVENLKKVCNEIFGYANFINTFIWQRNSSAKTELSKFTINTEYILLYSRTSKYVLCSAFKPLSDASLKLFKFDDNDGRGKYQTVSLQKPKDPGPETTYDYIDNNGRVWECPPKGWRMKYEKIKALENDGRLVLTGTTLRVKDYWAERENEGKRIDTLWNDLPQNTTASGELEVLMSGVNIFSNPKPVDLIKRCLTIAGKEGIILDFFSGSATTAHAVMQLNAEDGGHRKFIMVQLPEKTDEKSEAYKTGYKNICEIGKERIRRAGRKIKGEARLQGQDLDIGFRVLKLDGSNMQDVYYTPRDFTINDLFADNVKPGRTAEDLLFQVMLDLGVELFATIEQRTMDGKHVFFVNDNYLVACFDTDIAEDTIKAIAKLKPYYFVMRDSSLASDNVADNFDQLFETYSKDTIRKII